MIQKTFTNGTSVIIEENPIENTGFSCIVVDKHGNSILTRNNIEADTCEAAFHLVLNEIQ